MLYIQMIQEQCHIVIKDSMSYIKSIKFKDRQKPVKISIPVESIENEPCLSFVA